MKRPLIRLGLLGVLGSGLILGCSGGEEAAGDGSQQAKPASSDGDDTNKTVDGTGNTQTSPTGTTPNNAPPPKPTNPNCDMTKPLASTKKLATEGEGGRSYRLVTFLPDQLTMFIKAGDVGIQSLSRATVNDVFGSPKPMGYSNGRNVSSFSITSDGLNFYSAFAPNTNGTGLPDGTAYLYLAKRGTLSAKFGDGAKVDELGGKVTEPYIAADGKSLLLTQGGDIMQSVKTGATFGKPVKISEIDTDANEINPVLSGDGHTIFFKRSEKVGATISFFLWSAYRKDVGSPFEAPAKVTQLADPDDTPKWSSTDGCTLYVERRTSGTLGLWQATFGK